MTDFAGESRSSYGDFLQLKTLLDLQKTFQEPAKPDEMMFIIIHQVNELWLKLMHHHLVEVRYFLCRDEFGPAMKNIDRIKAIQRQLIGIWETLVTMDETYIKVKGPPFGDCYAFTCRATNRCICIAQ